jgi:flagellar biosynthesis/type III secretory pathway protein FliH
VPPQPQPPAPVDTTQARNDGLRDGAAVGDREGRQQGYSDGINAGESDGRNRGTNEGDAAGRQTGYRDGYNVDQSAGTQKGNVDGQNAGTTNGTQAGQKRCYDEGYTGAYNSAYVTAKQAGEQDAASYNAGYANGQADASVTEVQNGQKAGYQAGFSQREAELQNSTLDARGVFARSALTKGAMTGLPIELARNGYNTPQEQQAYQQAYQEGYRNSYQRAYSDAKQQGYNERYQNAYRRAYNAQYSISYQAGYSDGKDKGYQDAYNSAYTAMYNQYYDSYSVAEYADQRANGQSNGQAAGQKDGFASGCADQTKRGYNDGYAKTEAAVYPGAFNAGKQSGIAAATKYYNENAVLKVANISFVDENGNGKFEADENIVLKAEVRNFGFQKSDTVAIVVKSDLGEITLVPDLKADGVGGRAKTVLTLKIGKLYDVVAPNADTLHVTFLANGQPVGDYSQMYTRTNPNKVGVVAKDGTDVKKKATWFFPGTAATLNHGEKVIITGQDGSYYKVRKAELGAGNWTEGYIKSDELTLQ